MKHIADILADLLKGFKAPEPKPQEPTPPAPTKPDEGQP